MNGRAIYFTIAVIVVGASRAPAALIVNPPLPITHRVTVQVIQTALNNGTSPATIFGDSAQRAHIEASIDAIWAQAGIDVAFLPTKRYNNTFAYQGNGGTRPLDDLGRILSAAGQVMNPDPSVINMFFVNVAPGFAFTSESTVNGVANIGTDGIAQFVGDNLLAGVGGRDIIAGVVAHEIGHNLGLKHSANGIANLMSPQGTTDQISAQQIQAVFQTTYRNDAVAYIPSFGTGFPKLIPLVLPGDYNRDGIVNSPDFIIWRNNLGSTVNLAADGNGNGRVDDADYTFWRSRFGTTVGSGASPLVPEPATWSLVVAAAALFAGCRRTALHRL
jgi:hypothetical protein